jgi:putative surface-exposed virulence protein
MYSVKKSFLFVAAILIVLFAALYFVSPVSADDGGQPADAVVVSDVEAPAVVVEEPTEAAPPVEEISPVVEEPTVEEALVEPDIVVDAADAIVRDSGDVPEGDPYFTVGSTTYHFVLGSCSGVTGYCESSTTPIQDALDYMETNSLTPTDRKLYIEAGTYVEQVIVDGSANGVKGLAGIQGVGTDPEDVQIDVGLYVDNFTTGFSISNLTVNGWWDYSSAIGISNNTGTITLTDVIATDPKTDSSGISINHTGAVILNRVSANDSGGIGAYIYTTGPVTIKNSTFDGNLQDIYGTPYLCGLYIDINGSGAVTLDGVSAQNNKGDGVDIDAPYSTVTIKNGVFSQNDNANEVEGWGDGLWVYGNTVVVENVVANSNDMRGAYFGAATSFSGIRITAEDNGSSGWNGVMISTCLGWQDDEPYCHNTGAGTVTIKTSSVSGSQGGTGFSIWAKGAVTLYDIWTGYNNDTGIFIDNSIATSPAAVNLTLITSVWNTSGIHILTRGAVTGTNVKANENGGDGLVIESSGTAPITFTINPINTPNDPYAFNETIRNGGNGFAITTLGAVSLTSFDSYENGGYGGFVDNSSAVSPMAVTIKVLDPILTHNGYMYNGDFGLQVLSKGAVTISNARVNSNQAYGALIVNGAAPVIISNSYFNSNCASDENGCYDDGDMDHNGLWVQSNGAITLLNLSAEGNYGEGAHLDNWWPGATGGVTINAGTGVYNSFSYNQGNGLTIYSHGAITTTNIIANGNTGNGATLENNAPGYAGGVTLNASAGMGNIFGQNTANGLQVLSNGAVTMTNIDAWSNFGGNGVKVINNWTGTAPVTIKQVGSWYSGDFYVQGNYFSNNEEGGLNVLSNGVVTVAFYHANANHGVGIDIDSSGGVGAVTVSGMADRYENVSSNWDDGIEIDAKGNITLNNIESYYNSDTGADLENTFGTGGITINNGYFDGNTTGLYVDTTGAVIWKNGSASGNANYGASIGNDYPLIAAKPVTITNVIADNNSETGLTIISKGAVLLTNVEACNNSANYYYLNYGDDWTDNLTDDQNWIFDGSDGDSITVNVNSYKFTPAIWITDGDGNYVTDSYVEGADGEVTLTLDLTANGTYYIHVSALQWNGVEYVQAWNGNSYEISLVEGTGTVVYTYSSAASGVYVDNRDGTNAAVTFTNTGHPWNSNNSGTDVEIRSKGVVTVTNMDLNDSGENGLFINNSSSTTTPGVNLTNVNFYNNDITAAHVITKGAVTVKDNYVSSNNSAGYGYYIDNSLGTTPTAITFTNVEVNSNGEDGIYLRSNGLVTLANVSSNYNGGSGIDIATDGAVIFTGVWARVNNEFGAYVVNPVSFTLNKPTSGFNSFSGNVLTGLYIETNGKVTITNTYAQNNGWWDYDSDTDTWYTITDAVGIDINVTNPLGTSPVVITNAFIDKNTLTGLYINTSGAVTVNKLTSNNNFNDGLFIDQISAPTSLFPILLSNIDVEGNWQNGLSVEAKGNVTLSKFVASSNSENGVYINNTYGTGSVTILNPVGGNPFNWAMFNAGRGVDIRSNGAVTVTGAEFLANGQSGLWVDNSGSPTSTLVTLTGITSRGNGGEGILVFSDGIVTINNAWAVSNHGDGILVFTTKNVFINNSSAINNDWAGMWIDLTPSGNLTLTGCSWFGNLRNPLSNSVNLYFAGGTKTIH